MKVDLADVTIQNFEWTSYRRAKSCPDGHVLALQFQPPSLKWMGNSNGLFGWYDFELLGAFVVFKPDGEIDGSSVWPAFRGTVQVSASFSHKEGTFPHFTEEEAVSFLLTTGYSTVVPEARHVFRTNGATAGWHGVLMHLQTHVPDHMNVVREASKYASPEEKEEF